MPSTLGPVEDPPEEGHRTGICCSGGGIRSASFNLGALQVLQREGQLQDATYLAAVSGGSYIAAAFSTVAKAWSGQRPAPGESGHDDSEPAALAVTPPFAPGSPEEEYLRNRCSYMAPTGVAKFALGLRIVAGLAFNVFFLALPIFVLGVVLALLYSCLWVDATAADLGGWPELAWGLPLGAAVLGLILLSTGLLWRPRADHRAAFLGTWSTRLLFLAITSAVILDLIPWLVGVFADEVEASTDAPSVGETSGVAGGVVALLAGGVFAYLRSLLVAPAKLAKEAGKVRKQVRKASPALLRAIGYAVGGLVAPLLLLGGLVASVHYALPAGPSGELADGMCVAGIAALAAFLILYLLIDITAISLHPFYKRRLSSAFSLKRIRQAAMTDDEKVRAEAVPNDPEVSPKDPGIAMERDYDLLVPLEQTALENSARWPTLIVCAAANVGDIGATPPGREVSSFTFSAHSVGGPLVGAISTGSCVVKLGKEGEEQTRDARTKDAERRLANVTLPAAVAMSGAAVSPSMGKLTKKPFRFLLALANVRLGVWVPNPRWVAAGKSRQFGFGRPRPIYLFRELFGGNRVNSRYLYVTDGGHYENLGLVELLRRGCTRIYCIDASGGESFEALGDAIALARSELGVEIDIDVERLRPDAESGVAASAVRVGRFRYRGSDQVGTLVYARNVLTEDSSWDTRSLHETNPVFPHHPTTDQLFTDQKFEGYRALGQAAAERAITRMKRRVKTLGEARPED